MGPRAARGRQTGLHALPASQLHAAISIPKTVRYGQARAGVDRTQNQDRSPGFKPGLCSHLCCKLPHLGPVSFLRPEKTYRVAPGPFQVLNPSVTLQTAHMGLSCTDGSVGERGGGGGRGRRVASTDHSARILASPQLQALAVSSPPPHPSLSKTQPCFQPWHGTSHVSSPCLALQRDI